MPTSTKAKQADSWQEIKAKKEARNKHLADMRVMLDKLDTDKRSKFTAEEETRFQTLNSEAEAIKTYIERREADRAELERGIADEERAGRSDTQTPEQTDANKETYKRALNKVLRGHELDPEEQRAMTVSSQGGVVGNREFYGQVVVRIAAFDGVRSAGCKVLQTSTGNDITIPCSNDTSNMGRVVGEAVANTNTTEPTNTIKTLKGYQIQSDWIKPSTVLVQDAEFDLQGYIIDIGGERIGRRLNQLTTAGAGSGSAVEGFLVGGSLGKTTTAEDAFDYEELVDFQHSINQGYRKTGKCMWQLADTTLAAARKLKDGDGRYIFNPGIAGQPETLLGAGYVVNDHMPALTDALGKIIAWGDWSRYFCRDVTGMRIIVARERFAEDGVVGFMIESRHDGCVTDASAIKYMQLAAGE